MTNQLKPLRSRWRAMIARCHTPHNPIYRWYGARGITVCDRWRTSFEAFVEDMGYPPHNYQIDRIDNNGNYEPSNCRWVDRTTNNNNRRRYDVQNRPMRHLRLPKQGNSCRLSIRLKRNHTYEKSMPTLEAAMDLRDLVEYEREFHRRLGLI